MIGFFLKTRFVVNYLKEIDPSELTVEKADKLYHLAMMETKGQELQPSKYPIGISTSESYYLYIWKCLID